MDRVTIYTDGSCHGNPGPGGYAAILLHKNSTKEVHGSDWYTTNNRMELKAVIEGLRMLTQPSEATIITDSQYIAKTINRGNLRAFVNTPGRKNADLWEQVMRLAEWHTIKAQWVRGHSGNKLNQRCDAIANREASLLEKEKKTRLIVFSELLKDVTITAEEIARQYKCSLNTVEKYYYQFFDRYAAENGGATNAE